MLSVQLYINDSPVAVFCLPASADNPGERQKKHQPLPLPPATYGLTARHEPRLSGKIYLQSAALPASLPVPDGYRLPLLSAVTDDSDSPKHGRKNKGILPFPVRISYTRLLAVYNLIRLLRQMKGQRIR